MSNNSKKRQLGCFQVTFKFYFFLSVLLLVTCMHAFKFAQRTLILEAFVDPGAYHVLLLNHFQALSGMQQAIITTQKCSSLKKNYKMKTTKWTSILCNSMNSFSTITANASPWKQTKGSTHQSVCQSHAHQRGLSWEGRHDRFFLISCQKMHLEDFNNFYMVRKKE